MEKYLLKFDYSAFNKIPMPYLNYGMNTTMSDSTSQEKYNLFKTMVDGESIVVSYDYYLNKMSPMCYANPSVRKTVYLTNYGSVAVHNRGSAFEKETFDTMKFNFWIPVDYIKTFEKMKFEYPKLCDMLALIKDQKLYTPSGYRASKLYTFDELEKQEYRETKKKLETEYKELEEIKNRTNTEYNELVQLKKEYSNMKIKFEKERAELDKEKQNLESEKQKLKQDEFTIL